MKALAVLCRRTTVIGCLRRGGAALFADGFIFQQLTPTLRSEPCTEVA